MSDSRFIYFISQENTLIEMEAEEFSETSGVSAIQIANEYCNIYGFKLYTIESEQWGDEDWKQGYFVLENTFGLYTAERREELFDN